MYKHKMQFIMKYISLFTLLIFAVTGYAQDSTSTQSNISSQTYTTTTKSETYSTSTSTREFRPFKVNVGVGYAVPGKGTGAGGGVLFFVEPMYRAGDMVAIGLRLESAVLVRGVKGVDNDDVKGDANSNLSYTLNTQYYFNKNNVRPFIGIGGGLYSLAAMKFNTASSSDPGADDVGAATVFGFYPRIGVDAGHFNLTLDYNFIPKSNVPGGGQVVNSYLGIRAGVAIGGGRINKPMAK
jgi:outer membrane protein W